MHQDDTAPEEWRSVVGYEGRYEVSSRGQVRTVRTGLIRKFSRTTDGYLTLNLSAGSRSSMQQRRVHVLVAEAFIGPKPTPEHGVNHLNTIKTDNWPSNLEWATPGENNAHAGRMGLKARGDAHHSRLHPERLARGDRNGSRKHPERLRRGELNSRALLTDADVAEIKSSKAKRGALAARFNVSTQVIYRIRCGQTWKHVT